MVKAREEVLLEDRWNVEDLYKNKEEWQKPLKRFL